MKVVILAGGLGSRISEESRYRPKPMIELGGKPVLWHIMKTYSQYGFNEFIILAGYKGYFIKEYFMNYYTHMSDITFDIANNSIIYHKNNAEPWKVTVVDTGINTMTGGRIKRVSEYINNERFMLTYGDGVSDVNIKDVLSFHESHGKAITMTGVQVDGRFGALQIDEGNKVSMFKEKPKGDGSWINGGYFICEPKVLDYIGDDDSLIFEREPLENLAKDGELFTYKHYGYWKPMDTLRDKIILEELVESGTAPWMIWKR